MGGEGSDDKAAEGGVELLGGASGSGSADELGIGAGNVLAGGFAVLEVTFLPPGEAFGIRHLNLALPDGFGESADSTFAALGEGAGVRVQDSVSVGAAVAGAHNDALLGGELATEVVEGKSGLNFSHRVVNGKIKQKQQLGQFSQSWLIHAGEPVGSV